MDETHASGTNDPNATKPPEEDASQAKAGTPKRRRRWPWVILGIVLVLILLVLLAPTLLSTGAGKSFVVDKVTNSLNGKLDIADWSVGWPSARARSS